MFLYSRDLYKIVSNIDSNVGVNLMVAGTGMVVEATNPR